MNHFHELGKFLVIAGLVIAGLGVLLLVLPKIPFLGRLPGDIVIRRENFTFYFPLGTSILLSVVLSIILYLLRK